MHATQPENPVKVLIADDDPCCRLLLQHLLTKQGFDVHVCQDGVTALRLLLEERAPQIAILDWMMPGMEGLEVCREVRKRADRYAYLILLTGRCEKVDRLNGFDAGADDFLHKPVDKDELRVRLRAGQRILAWQDQLIAAREQMKALATQDSLTGVWNKRAVSELLERELHRSQRIKLPVGVAMIDLDHFKLINDSHGHMAGDAVLEAVGGRLTAALRQYDLVGRFGGEEFLVVMPGCGENDAFNCCERLRLRIAAAPVSFEGRSIDVTASIGAAVASGEIATHPRQLIGAADNALYAAKARGRNRVVLGAVEFKSEQRIAAPLGGASP